MGGVWGLASSTALENLPVELRGLGSGIVQQGYALGYLMAAVVNLTIVPHNPYKWRAMFWTGSSLLFTSAVLRALLPESAVFLRAKAIEKEKHADSSKKTQIFFKELKQMLKQHWLLCVYAILLMAGALFAPSLFVGYRLMRGNRRIQLLVTWITGESFRINHTWGPTAYAFIGSLSDVSGKIERFFCP